MVGKEISMVFVAIWLLYSMKGVFRAILISGWTSLQGFHDNWQILEVSTG